MMILIHWFAKSLNIKLLASCILSLTLIAPSVLAVYEPGTQKPVPSDRRSDSGTTRGCAGENMPLTILASRNYVGRTISKHPTLAWFVPGDSASKPIEFKLYEWTPGGKPKEVRKMSLQSSPGVMKVSPFAKNEPGLQLGKEYLWQVVLHCDLDNPSGDLVSEAMLEVVEVPASMLQSKLNKAVNSGEKANIYAEAGLWYNALDEALKLAKSSKLGELGSTLLNDLAKSEAQNTSKLSPKEQKDNKKQVENLQQIARSAR